MFSKFQSVPSWLLGIFVFIWVLGWGYYFIKPWLRTNKESFNTNQKEKMVSNWVGFFLAMFFVRWIRNWIQNNFFMGLDGLHAGIVAGLFIFVMILIFQILGKLVLKFAKIFSA